MDGRDSELAGLEGGQEGRVPAESGGPAQMPADSASEQRLGAGRRARV